MRDIFLCDLNNFYASCEMAIDESIRDLPVAVSGRLEERKGVVIAKNYKAKEMGVDVGDLVFQALQKCPNLVVKPTNFELYNKYSKMVREILLKYTDRVEPFSIDECFMDVTNSKIFGTPLEIANKIKEEVKEKLGITMSIGVSYNKTFAKIASEFKKPDAVSVVTKGDYKEKIWTLDISKMVGIGKRLEEKLKKYNINTIKDLANVDFDFISRLLGKVGRDLKAYASGDDYREVDLYEHYIMPKSVGNSTTFYRDLIKKEDIILGFTIISESVVNRMIKYNLQSARTMTVHAKDKDLNTFSKQVTFDYPTRSTNVITQKAVETFYKYFNLNSIRLLGIHLTNFSDSFINDNIFKTKGEKNDIDKAVLEINQKLDKKAVFKLNNLLDDKISSSFDRPPLQKK
ncbi:MAG: DNA polymerase IV [Clostridiales bacterium]|nr:DNA polymerase IV [Clostridiales bacterium]